MDPMEWVRVIVLGVVQGITEFLPVSSTGHLIVAAEALDFQNRIGGTFEIFIQIGSVLSVVLFYRADLWRQVRTVTHDRAVQRLWLNIVVAAIPAAVVGFLARDFIKTTLFSPVTVGVMLIVGGVVFLLIDRPKEDSLPAGEPEPPALESITFRQAISVGLVQIFALIPGTSRSGASIVGGLLSGLNRQTATAFSFYLAIPVLGGATVLDLLLSLDEITPDQVGLLALGTVVTALVSFVAVGWLLRYISRNSFVVFGYYRILAGIVILALVALDILSVTDLSLG